MAKLERSAGRTLFAPVIFRLALKLEQVAWTEFTGSASEAVFVLRATQRLFKQDVIFTWFDTWLEAEAAGVQVERDELGRVVNQPQPPAAPPAVEALLAGAPVAHAVEIVRRLRGEPVATVAMLTAGATLLSRFAGGENCRRILWDMGRSDVRPADRELLGRLREVSVGLARAYCEAGAGALLLVQEEASPDLADLADASALFNLAEYYATPVMLLCRDPLSERGCAVAEKITGGLYATPTQAGSAIVPLPNAGLAQPTSWLALSRWEVDPETPPDAVRAWQSAFQAA
jgi:uroporphyrinogen-III decarboxylase